MCQLEKAAALACLLVGLGTLPAPAQEAAQARGGAGPIGKEALLERLKNRERGGPLVSGHVIRGKDLIGILRETDVPIQLEKCIIEEGLVFRDVGTISVPIEIKDCELRAAPVSRAPWTGASIDTMTARFTEKVAFTHSTFAGRAVFANTVFEQYADFLWTRFPQSVEFTGATFVDAVSFSRALLTNAHISGATFKKQAAFRGARFETQADFDGAMFADTVDFRKAVFKADQAFGALFSGPANFEEVRFEGNAKFLVLSSDESGAAAAFQQAVTFEQALFGANAIFQGLVFPALAEFNDADFVGIADFAQSRFEARARFDRARFRGGANFSEAAFEDSVGYQSAAFEGENDFTGARFVEDVSFVGAHFVGLAFFVTIEAESSAHFRSALFDDEANFESANFGDTADFQGTIFKDLLTLTSVDLGTYANFRDSRIAKLDFNSAYNPTIVSSRIDMRGACIADAHLQDVIFEANVDFSDASFGLPIPQEGSARCEGSNGGTSILRFVTFEDDASFARARFGGRLAIDNVRFRGVSDFTDADFRAITRGEKPSFSLSYVDFGDLLLNWSQLPEPRYWVQAPNDIIRSSLKGTALVGALEPTSRTFSKLESNFRDAGRLDDANAAFFHRKRAELHEARTGDWDLQRVFVEAEWVLWGLICGYGTKIWWAVAWALIVDLLFTLFYWSSASVIRNIPTDTPQEFNFRLRLLDLPKEYTAGRGALPVTSPRLRKLIDSLRVSSVILFKVGHRDTTIAGRLGPLPMEYVVATEWVLGFYLLAALTVTLANTQPLINRLISGVF